MPITNTIDMHITMLKVPKSDYKVFKAKCKERKVYIADILRSFIRAYNNEININIHDLRQLTKQQFNILIDQEVNRRMNKLKTNI